MKDPAYSRIRNLKLGAPWSPSVVAVPTANDITLRCFLETFNYSTSGNGSVRTSVKSGATVKNSKRSNKTNSIKG